jgi:hypothetical protein
MTIYMPSLEAAARSLKVALIPAPVHRDAEIDKTASRLAPQGDDGRFDAGAMSGLNMTAEMRRPNGVIHHSDQGSQYTSIEFGHRCREADVRPSMGSVGDAYDNAMCESFFATLECKLLEAPVQDPGRGADRGVRVHRRFSAPAALRMACCVAPDITLPSLKLSIKAVLSLLRLNVLLKSNSRARFF